MRGQMKNRKGSDIFAMQAREVTFSKLLGLSVDHLYAKAPVKGEPGQKKVDGKKEKIDLDSIQLPYYPVEGAK